VRTPVLLPELGAATVHLSLWFVEPGTFVRQGEPLVELLLPGATFDVSAPVSGRLLEWRAWQGDPLAPGQVLGVLESGDPTGV
jgi:pyruvate/2-oxoglutarate dehydrogenase complex dihydrolipoamide acyltransferase (E2) component